MASTSKVEPSGGGDNKEEEEEEGEELERFDDFTLASSWERFISEIEAVCRKWLADGPKNLLEKGAVQLEFSQKLYKVKFELRYAMKSYSMEYYFETNSGGKIADWDGNLHDLQLCFGVKEFLVIAPQSASGVVLDAPEASKLLSAVAIALSNCSSLWPAFVPVHDPSRKAYIGIQNMGTVFTRRFEADLIGSQVPVKLMHLEGLYELFVSKFAYTTLDYAMRLFKVHFTMKSTYRTILNDDDDSDIQSPAAEIEESRRNPSGDADTRNASQWDDDCPWSEWYSAEDPVKGLELIATWSEKMVESSLEMAEIENASPHDAEKWMILPILSPNLDSSEGNRIGFASQLRLLVNALDMSFAAQFMEDFVSVENLGSDNLKASLVVPPPTVMDRVFKDLFHEGSQLPDFAAGEHKSSRAVKGAPLESLFAQFCLHCLWIGNCNIRAIAVLWVEFIREVRWCWEESQPLPKVPVNGSIDLSTCLIHQKLQMLAICIEKKCELNEDFQDCVESNDQAYADIKGDGPVGNVATHIPSEEIDGIRDSPLIQDGLHRSEPLISKSTMKHEDGFSSDLKPPDRSRRGSAGVVGTMMLLKSYQSMHAPFTQDPPLMTEDMHEERLQAVEVFGDSFSFSAQLERDILSSDMSAFKAANPDAVFEDFIRWHSPGDWENDESAASRPSKSSMDCLKDDWPPRGRLSQRMSEHGNLWRKIWNDVPALPAYEQKPFLDPNREGEKILHYLETLRPHQLLEQMVCTAFRASADTLNRTKFGGLKQMTVKIEQFYRTMISMLKRLQTNSISGNGETIEDLRQLCDIFEHVEKLLTLATSLHRKFMKAPRLSEEIFSDYYNYYTPRMGTGSLDVDQREFGMKQKVSMHERRVVSNMFAPPSANQTWRKVLSMGNLLNGHEPIAREIIFSMRDSLSNHHYAAQSPMGIEQEMETYRMYICGTSNDLRVALSVTSCD
ncbi:rab3 GTPase-activating protein catalytic subunit isoform X2 [Ricinus communis]|uniref:rab3 GTPase-activating protein catalytic subunit isoform X2 n=1 Tax=Ricinus communis TaxID=3988 RepID=UPI0007727C6F|nr:rab3 GTPase-activating protein catalytic subunit isoform X2 [Ricinus communis]|eukprot:XP_015579317.1 rab3 GTPase-activating protein catalytic subunit isoform X2 [Ricinus communis]